MAKPIRNTPILTGTDAVEFNRNASVTPTEEMRKAERARLNESVNRFKEMLASLPQ